MLDGLSMPLGQRYGSLATVANTRLPPSLLMHVNVILSQFKSLPEVKKGKRWKIAPECQPGRKADGHRGASPRAIRAFGASCTISCPAAAARPVINVCRWTQAKGIQTWANFHGQNCELSKKLRQKRFSVLDGDVLASDLHNKMRILGIGNDITKDALSG